MSILIFPDNTFALSGPAARVRSLRPLLRSLLREYGRDTFALLQRIPGPRVRIEFQESILDFPTGTWVAPNAGGIF